MGKDGGGQSQAEESEKFLFLGLTDWKRLPGLLLAQCLSMSSFILVTSNNVRTVRSYHLFEFITYSEPSVPGQITKGFSEQYRYADCKKLADNHSPARWKNCGTFAMIARGEFPTLTLSFI